MSKKKEDNLIPFNELTEEEQRKLASAGGKRSGEVRREKANFRRALEAIFDGKPSKPLIGILKGVGIKSPEKLSYLEALIQYGTLKTHDKKTTLSELVRFLEFARDTIGQKPVEKKMDLTPENKDEVQAIINELIGEEEEQEQEQ